MSRTVTATMMIFVVVVHRLELGHLVVRVEGFVEDGFVEDTAVGFVIQGLPLELEIQVVAERGEGVRGEEVKVDMKTHEIKRVEAKM